MDHLDHSVHVGLNTHDFDGMQRMGQLGGAMHTVLVRWPISYAASWVVLFSQRMHTCHGSGIFSGLALDSNSFVSIILLSLSVIHYNNNEKKTCFLLSST